MRAAGGRPPRPPTPTTRASWRPAGRWSCPPARPSRGRGGPDPTDDPGTVREGRDRCGNDPRSGDRPPLIWHARDSMQLDDPGPRRVPDLLVMIDGVPLRDDLRGRVVELRAESHLDLAATFRLRIAALDLGL